VTNKLVRRLLAGVLVLAAAGSIQAQTVEIYAGGAKFRNTPGQQMPVIPRAVTIGPDGMVYVSDAFKGRLIRFDPATGTATVLPGLDPPPPPGNVIPDFDFSADALAMNAEGELYGATWQEMFRIDIQQGTREFLTGDSWSTGTSGQMTFDANGNLYYLKRNNAIYSDTNLFRRGPWGGYPEQLIRGDDYNFHGDGGPLAWAGMSHARGVALDAQGNLYIADSGSNRIRKITAIDGEINPEESIITTVAGNGEWYSYDENVPATSTGLASPESLAIDVAGNIYIHERGRNRVRRVSAVDGTISTYAGGPEWGYLGDGGPATEAHIELIDGNIALDAQSNLYLAEMGANRLRRVNAATGIIETVLGNGTMTFCTEVSPRREACLGGPRGVAVDAGGNVYISDSRNLRIRRIDATTGELRTVAGADFSYTHGGDGGPASVATFANDPGGISFDAAGNLLIAGGWANNVRRIDATTGVITTIAGTGVQGFAGDGGLATAAQFANVQDVASDAAGNIYVLDSHNRRIRRISASGIVTTIAGNGSSGFSGDGGAATTAGFQYPTDIDFDASGNVLVADYTRLRRIDAATGIIMTIAGNGSGSIIGDGGPASAAGIGYGFAMRLDAGGDIVLASSNSLRRIDTATGIIDSVSLPYGLSTPDGMYVQSPTAMAFGPQGALFVTDDNLDLVFRIDGVPLQDTTPPVINPVVNGDAGVEGWYRSDVALSWSVSDPESEVESTDGCSAASITQDTSGVTFSCTATSSGGQTSRSVTIRRDTVAPIVWLVQTTPAAPDSLGWYNQDIRILFVTQDTLSGVYSRSSESPLLIQEEGTGVSRELVVTDRAGNSTTYTSPAFNLDLYPPAIASGWMGPQGNDNWHTSDVDFDWEIYEPISPIRSSQGCDDFTLSFDTPGTSYTCTATSAGGTMTSTRTLKRDATPPTLMFGPPSPAPNASGWHNSDVSFPFTTSDGTSGVASTSSSGPVVITGEGTGLTATVTVTDAAGNSAIFTTPPVNIDRTVPLTVTPVIAGTLGNDGWYTSNVEVSWNLTGNVLNSTGCGASNVIGDTAGLTFTCSVSGTNGTASNSVTLKRDATPPVLTWRPATPNANAAGWNRTNVSFPYNAPTDALSGVLSVSSASPLVVSAEGAGVTGSVTVTDRAGNAAVFTTTPRNIDKTAPTVTVRTPLHNKVYGLYSTLIADFDCTDAVSGTTSCSGTTANGATLNTRSMNSNFTFRVTSADVAGNSVTKSNAWSVAGSFLFDGYLAPMGNDPVYNLVTAGTRVPMRFRLPDRNGGYVSDLTAFQSFNVATERCISSSTPLNDVATGGPGLSFDSATSTFTYNWDTNASWAGTCRNVNIRLIDGSRHTLYFKFQ
jgi:sugar lactone lactonase YvrE